ncbi:transmembrane protein 70, mitochondrial [Lampetra fluviatilis]
MFAALTLGPRRGLPAGWGGLGWKLCPARGRIAGHDGRPEPVSMPRLASTSYSSCAFTEGGLFDKVTLQASRWRPWTRRGLCSKVSGGSTASAQGWLIYDGNFTSRVRGVKVLSYSSSVMSLAIAPTLMAQTGLAEAGTAFQALLGTAWLIFTFMTPAALHFITRSYVSRLYHNPECEEYTAVTLTAFLTERHTSFHRDAVAVPGVARMFTTFTAAGRPFLVDPSQFRDYLDFAHLMGHDQPFVFKQEESVHDRDDDDDDDVVVPEKPREKEEAKMARKE